MSWSRRSFLLAVPALAACGFRPVYGPGGAAEGLNGRIALADPKTRDGFALAARLEDRLGPATAPLYRLDYIIETDSDPLAVTQEQETTRYDVIGRVRYRLTALDTGALADSGTVRSFTGYSATGSTLATLTARRDAYERLMVILADQIVARLVAGAAARTP
ncbi:LPS-assembly lipoprotein [Rhodovulum iodosum]|uniref:LPS-assembly lipoprotein n=1 Tax=Rhodovulum iodosum TaxID=68291 RepID=A0ABV3XRX8_9RHOB|nr:LPS assembly lipoprotein LptE [Rhodovulum robiginosum]RSK30426.1 hypothetical protein EJA01_16710 [Rhodovulum robiginosum]